MAHLSLSLFGPLTVVLNGQPVKHFRSDKVLALLIYLTVEAQTEHQRGKLAGLLWPDQPERVARHNLSQTLLRLRQVLQDRTAEPHFLIVTRQTIQFNQASPYQLDVQAFEAYLAATTDDERSKVHNLRRAVALYHGDFLHHFYLAESDLFEEWAMTKRAYWRQQVFGALEQLVAHYDTTRAYELGQHYAWQLVELDTLREESHRSLMRLLALNGQRSAALAQYDTCYHVLTTEFDVEPAPETVALYEQIRDGSLSKKAALQTDQGVQQTLATAPSRPDPYLILSRLDPLPDQQLFGIEAVKAALKAVLEAQQRSWLIAIDGIGGIGKTTLASTLIHDLVSSERFHNIGWVSAKQEEFAPEVGIRKTGKPALDADTLIATLLDQLLEQPHLAASPQEKRLLLTRLLKEQPHLIVIDNLETVIDYQSLLPTLRHLANPGKFLLTSRFSLKANTDVFCYSLNELSRQDTLTFLRHEAQSRGINALAEAHVRQLESIYEVVGGNPLALKMVIGQISFLPLSHVLESLQQARGQKVDQLYTYIYWQAWHMLTETSRQLLLTLPIVPDGTFEELMAISELPPDNLIAALQQLIALSLVIVEGDLEARIYRLHRLTETFLLNEVLKWEGGYD
jgi:DNA-binding SARP family transcriptional activator